MELVVGDDDPSASVGTSLGLAIVRLGGSGVGPAAEVANGCRAVGTILEGAGRIVRIIVGLVELGGAL